MSATYEVRGEVAVITLTNPPVNGLGHETRRGIAEGLARALGDAAVKAVVLTGAGKAFSGGADIREFNSPKAGLEPSLPSLILAIEASAKPVVAALHSVAMGGGLELALGCHYRVAAAGCKIALPEVKLGLIPGAGGTQRLPRVLGLETALNLIVSGEPVLSEQLVKLPGQALIDKLVDGDVVGAAVAFAREKSAVRPLPKVRDLKVSHPNAQAFLQFARNTVGAMSRNFPAPLKAVDAVAASMTMKIDEGLLYERALFMGLMITPESKALRHAFVAERATSKIPDVPDDTPTRPIAKVAVIGAGTMGGGIAMNFLNAGIPVVMLEMKQEALDKGLGIIRKNYDAQVKKGKLKQDKLDQRMAALTSTLDVDRIAAFTKRPQDVIGMHFFSPANVMRLLEVIRGRETAKDVLATVMKLGKQIKKTTVVSGVCDGFIGNRMIEQYSRQAGFLLEEGATPQQVDKAMEKFGMAMGPFRMGDLAGNDVGWYIRKRRYVEKPEVRYSKTADLLCELGRFGQKTGAGWYDYVPGKRDAIPSTVVVDMIEKHRATLGIAPRKIGDEEIVGRLVYALVNEGAKIVEEGIALRASDIDMVYLTGYGFPLHRGGPMNYADQVGLYNVVAAMKRFAANPHDDAGFWHPASLLARLAAEGKTFS